MFAKGLSECEEHTHERAKNNHAANFDCLARIRMVLWARDSRAASSLGVEFGARVIVKVLLDRGCDINAVSRNAFSATPLKGAAAFNKIDLARLLIARGANVNCCAAEGGSPLHEAAASGQIEFAKLLLDHEANINARDDNRRTPLAIGLEFKQAEMARFLRQHKATQ